MNKPDIRNRKNIILIAVAVAAALTVACLPALAQKSPQSTQQNQQNASAAKSTGGFTISPASTGTQITHGYDLQVPAGGQVTEYAYIKNFADQTVRFYLYGSDPTVSNTGSPAYKTHEQSLEGPGTWVRFDQPEIELKGGESENVRFIVTVPPGTAPGDYRAGITMEKGKVNSNVPGISIATRIISQAKIKVLGTTTGAAAESSTQEVSQTQVSWTTYYFWISLVLFIISLALLVWALLHEKRTKHGQPAKAGKHGPAAHHAGRSRGKPRR